MYDTAVLDMPKRGLPVPPLTRGRVMKLMMSAKDEDGREYLRTSGGEKIREVVVTSESTTVAADSESRSTGRQTRPESVIRFGQDELNLFNSRSDLAIVECSPTDAGFTNLERPEVVEMPFPFTAGEFEWFDDFHFWPSCSSDLAVVRVSDFPPDTGPLTSVLSPEPTPQPSNQPALAAPTKRVRKRKPRPIDPEESGRVDALTDMLRQLGGK